MVIHKIFNCKYYKMWVFISFSNRTTGEGEWLLIFRLFKSILFFVSDFHCTFSFSFQIFREFLFRTCFTSFHTHASLLTFFVCFLFHSWCSLARVSGKMLVHEFPISYILTEWYLHFSWGEIVSLGLSFVFQNHIFLTSTWTETPDFCAFSVA